MNGRVYDPMLGRFGTPDPMTSEPYDSQGWNRYSYVSNDPLNHTDPSGYCRMGCFWQAPFKALGAAIRRTPILGNILTVAAAAICTAVTGAGPVCGALASAAVTGLASGDLGQALKAGAIALATAAAFNFAGDITAGAGPLAKVAAHAAIGCGSAVASGGKCGPGALSGAIGAATTVATRGMDFTTRLIAVTTMGGLASVAGGGKFGNGAVTAAFGYLFNELLTRPALFAKDMPVAEELQDRVLARRIGLALASGSGGVIIQEITGERNGEPFHFFEAWEIGAGKKFPDTYARFGFDDIFTALSGDTQSVRINATATFYEGASVPSGWTVGAHPMSGILKSSLNPPPFLPYPQNYKASPPVERQWSWPK